MLEIGNRIIIYGGYYNEPRWLIKVKRDNGVTGEVIKFVPGLNNNTEVVIKLDKEIFVDDCCGNYLVLALRHLFSKWEDKETVSVELCNFLIEDKPYELRQHGEGVETAAIYEKLT